MAAPATNSPAAPSVVIAGNVAGSVVIGNNNFVVNDNHGTIVNQAPRLPVTQRAAVPRAPNPPILFLDRTDEARQVTEALTGPAPRAVALYGRDGVGKSSLLRQVANHLPAAYADGILLIEGARDNGVALTVDEMAQDIFDALFDSDPHLKVNQNTARPYLDDLKVLYLLDRLGLEPPELDKLADLCRAVIWNAPNPPRGEVAHALAVPPLPRAAAMELCAQKAQWAPSAADPATLNPMCELLEDLPLAIVTLAHWAQAQRATPAQALALLRLPAARAEPHGVRRALLAVLSTLPPAAHTLLGLAGAARGATVDRAALIEAAGLEPQAGAQVLDTLEALGLLTPHSPELSLHPAHRDWVRAHLPASADQERRLASVLLREAQARAGELGYLRAQLGNLLGVLERAVLDGNAAQIRAVARLIVPVVVLRGLWDQWQSVFSQVAEAAERSGERGLQGWALHELGTRALASGDTATAARLLKQALALRQQLGDVAGAAYTQHNLDFLLGLPGPHGPKSPQPPKPSLPTVAVMVSVLAVLAGAGLLVFTAGAYCLLAGCGGRPHRPGGSPTPPSQVAFMSATPTPPVTQRFGPSSTPTTTPLTPTPTASAPTGNPAVATTMTRTPTPSATASATPTVTPTHATPVIARNQTVILAGPLDSAVGVSNPWASGYTHQAGNAFLWEPLAYYGFFAQKEIPWLAESMTYDDSFTKLSIKLNPLAEWSDGQPVTAKDVAFTFNGEFTDDRLPYHAEFTQFVQDWSTPDDQTVILDFKRPAARFKYEVLTVKFDSGLPIVPEHVLGSQPDVTAYAGGLDMPHSGPYRLVSWDENQKTFALREDWWAIKAGLSADPAVKAVQILRVGGPRVPSLESLIGLLAKNEIDASLDLPTRLIASILKEDPNVTSWTRQAAPYGYVSAWPNALWMNDQVAPYSNPNLRKAMSLVIDRDVLDKLVYGGASVTTIYPFPLYPGLMQSFADSAPVKELEKQYNPRAYNPELSAKLMAEAGYKRVAGLWTDSQGQTVNATIQAIASLHGDLAPVLSDMLRAGGFDARLNFGRDAYANMLAGRPGLYLFGHAGGTRDPFAALNQFNSWFSAPAGSPAYPNYFSRYQNPEYDKLVDALAGLSVDDPQANDLAAAALGIYWRDTIDIPLVQWVDRIPYNQTYWTNWPSADNLAAGTSGAFWHETGPLVITKLVPAGSVSN